MDPTYQLSDYSQASGSPTAQDAILVRTVLRVVLTLSNLLPLKGSRQLLQRVRSRAECSGIHGIRVRAC